MRIQVRYFWFTVLSVVIPTLVWTLFVFSNSNTTRSQEFVLGFMFGSMGAGFLVYNASQTILWSIRARQFWNTFGVEPPIDPKYTRNGGRDWKIWSAIQPIVDIVLEIRAKMLDFAYEAENKIKDESPVGISEAMKRHDTLLKGSAAVDAARKNFQDPRELAFEWGLEVYDSYRSYVSSFERAGKSKRRKVF